MEKKIKKQKLESKNISAVCLVGGKYDEKLLRKCLNSLSWCDEVIKVETDRLKGNFSDWRNEGARQAKGKWLLYLDADEQVTPQLRKTISQVVSSDEFAAYAIPRRNILLGREMRHGGWWPDYVVRLIRKDKLVKWVGEIHEQPQIEGRVCHLKTPMIHVSHRNLSAMVEKTNSWSEIEARLLYESGHPKMNVLRFFSAGLREFCYRGIRKMGFLDGVEGMIEVYYQTYSRLITYAKLWEKQLQNKR